MLYFLDMTEDHELWSRWVTSLKERRLNELVAGLIIAGGPLFIVFCQSVYIAAPLFNIKQNDESFYAFMDLLEDSEKLTAFARALQTAERE